MKKYPNKATLLQGMGRYTLRQLGIHLRHLNHRMKATRIRLLPLQGIHTHRPHNLAVVIKDILVKGILRRRLQPRFTIAIITIMMMALIVPPFSGAV